MIYKIKLVTLSPNSHGTVAHCFGVCSLYPIPSSFRLLFGGWMLMIFFLCLFALFLFRLLTKKIEKYNTYDRQNKGGVIIKIILIKYNLLK